MRDFSAVSSVKGSRNDREGSTDGPSDSSRCEPARIDDSVLMVEFSNGSVLKAGPDDDYESWSYSGPELTPTRVIAIPGGELAIWLPQDV